MNAIQAVFEDGVFRPTQPVHLPEHCEVEIEYRVRVTPTNGAGEVVGSPASGRAIEDTLAEMATAADAAEWEQLPADLSDQLDHYVYGTPRQ